MPVLTVGHSGILGLASVQGQYLVVYENDYFLSLNGNWQMTLPVGPWGKAQGKIDGLQLW